MPFVLPQEFRQHHLQVERARDMTCEEVWSTWCDLAGHGHGAAINWCGPVDAIWRYGGVGPREPAMLLGPGLSMQLRWPTLMSSSGVPVAGGWWQVNREALDQSPAYQEWQEFVQHCPVLNQYFTEGAAGPTRAPLPPCPPPLDMTPFLISFWPVADYPGPGF